MRWFGLCIAAALILQCSNAASISGPRTSENSDSSSSKLPWNNIYSFISYYATSTPIYDTSTDEDTWHDCPQEDDSASSETVIIYDVEEPVRPANISTTVNNTHLDKVHSSKHKRDAGESTDLSEARHKEVRPYPGYFLGRKLWYVPLWFGIYYSFYLLCLVVKSVARHRIHYPALLPADTTLERKKSRQKSKNLDAVARRFKDSLKMYNDRYRS